MTGSKVIAQPFLTEAQRAALDEALKRKHESAEATRHDSKVGGVGAHSRHTHYKPRVASGDRKSRMAKGTGEAKKGGAGGKFTWGRQAEDEAAAPVCLDKHDPNYDSEEDAAADGEDFCVADDNAPHLKGPRRLADAVRQYKEAIMELLKEYYQSGDVAEAAATLGEQGLPQYDYYLVKRALTLAMDRHDREREMSSVLLSDLYGSVITPEQMQKGFVSVIEGLEDLLLDVPDAVGLLSTFIARAVVDDILPPSFIQRLQPVEGTHIGELKSKCEAALAARHSAERMLRCWGSGAGIVFDETKASILKMLDEFVSSGDVEEVDRRLRALAVPFFHHEVVKQTIHYAISKPDALTPLMELLAKLSSVALVSEFQMLKGFQRVTDYLDDLCLDNPEAKHAFKDVLTEAKRLGIFLADFDADAFITAAASVSSASPSSHAHSVQAFKTAAITALHEYLDSADIGEVARSIEDLGDPGLHHLFTKAAIRLAMDRKDREREMVSALLCELTPGTIGEDQMEMGFTRTLAEVDDLVLDIPEAVHLMGLFLGRAIVDEALPPSFLHKVLHALRPGALGVTVVENTVKLLSARHAAEFFESAWHGGSRSIEQLRDAIRSALREYMQSGDGDEAARCLRELDRPLYHHEVVLRALEMAFLEPDKSEMLMKLLAQLAESGEINQTQMKKGFDRVQATLDDLKLDYPGAPQQFADIKAASIAAKWLVV